MSTLKILSNSPQNIVTALTAQNPPPSQKQRKKDMPIPSLSLLRQQSTHHLPFAVTTASLLRQNSTHRLILVFAKQSLDNVSRKLQQQPDKNTLKARDAVKHFSSFTSLSPVLPPEGQSILSSNQAVGMVVSAQANFMRVIVQSTPAESIRISDEDAVDASRAIDEGQEGFRVGVELLCVVRAVLKKIRRRVLVGDKVLVGSIDWVDRRGMIENVYQRRSEILDPPIANVDHFLVLFSMDQPKLEPFMLTKFLVEAESTEIPLTLALNKWELVDEPEVARWRSRLRSWGYEPIFCSVKSKHGLDTLAFSLRDQTTVVVGPSGVGKSSLINALRSNDDPYAAVEEDNWFDPILHSKWFEKQRVGEVSARSGRGKHTTRNVSLLPLAGGGYLADTPGFNQPSLLKVTKHSLAQAFPEILKMLKDEHPKKCSFNDCLHLGEPGCIVKQGWERYPYYLQLLDEIRIREEFQLRTMGTKREGDVRYKMGDMGVMQAEPRLQLKKHRRQSRKRINQSLLDELDDEQDDPLDAENPISRAMEQEDQ
ncbi:hypothetical protein Nepgr_022625 [Nepenthes gracilis]|uniref:Ribosome biogenesis GTPase RsgA n=1 Tax=Nepenthes gracilis TaxID=150966 RepID=A0AAD3T0M9_NEPGR|nr:hypothetical protein Nepgr_022625 [Nepenthes gracilis]